MIEDRELLSMTSSAKNAFIKSWDGATRLFHWCLVASVSFAWLSHHYSEALGDPTLRWHRANGYFLLALLLFRACWGFIGSDTARFSRFLAGPAAVLGYARDLISGRNRHFLGHNPLGGWMVAALLLCLLMQGVSGLFLVDIDAINAGPLHGLVADATALRFDRFHHLGYKLIAILACIHIAANIFYTLVKKDPLIPAMLHGEKPTLAYEDFPSAPRLVEGPARALLVFCAALLGLLALLYALAGHL